MSKKLNFDLVTKVISQCRHGRTISGLYMSVNACPKELRAIVYFLLEKKVLISGEHKVKNGRCLDVMLRVNTRFLNVKASL